MRHAKLSRAFTLVELLVVIGIIALLISILLPALGAARRSASQVKCAAALKEIGNCFKFYSLDSKGYFPPGRISTDGTVAVKYNVNGFDATSTEPAYWFNFLAKYVQKGNIGLADKAGTETGNVRTRSVFWGCPAFEGYTNSDVAGNAAGVNRYQIGYGMNCYPTYTPDYPRSTSSTPAFGPPTVTQGVLPEQEKAHASKWPKWEETLNTSKSPNTSLAFLKDRAWSIRGADRCLVADGSLWLASSQYVADANKMPPQYNDANVSNVVNDAALTSISMWRHGRLPSSSGVNAGWAYYPASKGKLGYNILYADGHVSQSSVISDAFRSIRQKFPG